MAFSLFAIVISMISSPALGVSIMKAITFFWVATAMLVAFAALSNSELILIKQWLMTFTVIVIVSSALTLLRPAIANNLIPGSLQGILNHPQSLGTFATPAAAWILAGLILMRGRFCSIEIVLAVLIWGVMLMSLSRTAAVAASSAVIVTLLLRLLRGQRAAGQAGLARFTGIVVAGVVVVAMANSLSGQLAGKTSSFLLKRKSSDINTSFYQSRGWGILSQWNNFLDRPLLGHGFGVFPDGLFPKGIVEVAGIPISAPVEKGFVPTAVLEETGIIGGCLFIWMIASLAITVGNNTDLRWVAAFWAAVMVNFGEAVILAPGGIGLYIWLVIGLCVASGSSAKQHAAGTGNEDAGEPLTLTPSLMR